MLRRYLPRFIKAILFYIYDKFCNLSKRFEYRKSNVYFPLSSKVGRKVIFEGANKLGINTYFAGHLGYSSYIGANSKISAAIGKFCSISDDVKTISGVHPTSVFVSTSPVFYSLQKVTGVRYVNKQKFIEYLKVDESVDVIIGNDVCISTGVKILGGICIGDGAIIGMGAVVTKDVPAYSIVAGVPAKIINMRFDKDQIEFLLDFKWWDKDEAWLKKNADLFVNIVEFINKTRSTEI
tara:strand:- start:963 stop:1673 length:711 start_codon:yes stop_codon:yes gene_type:complete